MEAKGDFIGWKAAVLDLVAHVVEQLFERNANVEPIDTDVFVGFAEVSGPAPGFTEHLLVQLTQEAFGEDILALLARPFVAVNDVELFPLVEFSLRGEMTRNQTGQFISIQRRGTGRVVEMDGRSGGHRSQPSRHSARREPLSRLSARARVCASMVSREVDCASSAIV